MKNKLSDLNDHLFAQIERLGDEDLKGQNLKTEIDRAKAMANVATQIVNLSKVTVDAMKLVTTGRLTKADLPKLLGDK